MAQSIFSEADKLQLHKNFFPLWMFFVGVLRKFSEQLFTRQINSGRLSLKQAQFYFKVTNLV